MRDETWKLLQKYQIAYTIVDEPLLPPEIHITSNIAYFRWHGHGIRPWYNYRYRQEQLKPWIPKIIETSEKVEKVYGYFNNHFHGYAVENCLQVLEMLGVLTTEQAQAKNKVENYFKTTKTTDSTLEIFIESKERSVESLIRVFLGPERFKRAQRIKDNEITIQKQTGTQIKAKIRDYHIVIGLKNRIIQHDCAGWSRVLPNKRFCKHLGKLFFTLKKEKAITILTQIYK